MLARKALMLGAVMLLLMAADCPAQNEFETGLEKFFQSRKLIETLSIRNDNVALCGDCIGRVDNIVPQLKKGAEADKYIRIEGFRSSRDDDVAAAMNAARLVHDYLRERHDIKSNLFLTGYPAEQGSRSDSFHVDIVTYDRILPVEDAKIETVIIR